MSNVIQFPKSGVNAVKSFCDCGNSLEYWVGDDDSAYGVCPHCNLGYPTQIKMLEMEEDEE
jgi:hypothetical protein